MKSQIDYEEKQLKTEERRFRDSTRDRMPYKGKGNGERLARIRNTRKLKEKHIKE